MGKKMIIYEGIFFLEEEVDELIHSQEITQLQKIYRPLHITFKFRPKREEVFDDLVGSEIQVLIVGYGCDGQNSGFEVILHEDVERYFINMDEHNPEEKKIPHITASLALGASAVNTKGLKFVPLAEPIAVTGRFGYCVREKGKESISFEPVNGSKTKKIGNKPNN